MYGGNVIIESAGKKKDRLVLAINVMAAPSENRAGLNY